MKIITYSDIHLEFGTNIKPPSDSDSDLMVLAGDIITFRDFEPLARFLKDWKKPVLYVPGNHEYYTQLPMDSGYNAFIDWLKEHHPATSVLSEEAITIDGINFFGGTMWTDFDGQNRDSMLIAQNDMNDYKQIMLPNGQLLKPSDTTKLHQIFSEKLIKWFESDLDGPRVIITHHAPVKKANSRHSDSHLQPAFNSLDMIPIIEKYQPDLWIYGHTHECDDQMIGGVRIISNQSGYPSRSGKFECEEFDPKGKIMEIN